MTFCVMRLVTHAARVPTLGNEMNSSTPIPLPDPLDHHALSLAKMVAPTSWLPNEKVVHAIGRAVFPTVRYTSDNPRFSSIQIAGTAVGMYDDNATPEWALFWSHGLRGTRPKGWVIAHMWPTSHDINAYTHLANLAMVREPFAQSHRLRDAKPDRARS